MFALYPHYDECPRVRHLTPLCSQFPAMRQLSIKSAHGFVLVYSVASQLSLQVVQTRLKEIRSIKENSEVDSVRERIRFRVKFPLSRKFQ